MAAEDRTPWGETWDDLAASVLTDPDSPDELKLAAFLHQHGKPIALRVAVREAVLLYQAEQANERGG